MRNHFRFFTFISLFTLNVFIVNASETLVLDTQHTLKSGLLNSIETNDSTCRLSLTKQGNLITFRKIRTTTPEPDEWKLSWQSGSVQAASGDYIARMQIDGNLVIYTETGDSVYSTRTSRELGSIQSAKLVLDGTCRLKIYHDDEEVWSNIRLPPFKAGDVLQKGEMFRMTTSYDDSCISDDFTFDIDYFLILRNDCNLVKYVGTDMADKGSRVWSSKTFRPELDHCYLYLDDGKAALYRAYFDETPPPFKDRDGEYWRTEEDWINDSSLSQSYELVLNEVDGLDWRECCE